MNVDRRIIVACVILLLVLILAVAVTIGVREGLLCAGIVGGAVGSSVLNRRLAAGKNALDAVSVEAERLPGIPAKKEEEARAALSSETDDDKIKKANALLGDE